MALHRIPFAPRRATATVAGTALLAVAALAGCGGDDDGGDSRPLAHAALVARANAACRTASAQIARIPVASSIEDLGEYAQKTAAVGTTLHDELSELTPEQPDRTSFGRYLDALARSNALLGRLQAAADAGDRAAVSEAANEIASSQVGTYAAVAGFDACAAATQTPES